MNRESGFSIVELLVTLLVLAVLISIALPSLLTNRRQAHEMQTKLALANAAKAEAALQPASGGFITDAAALEAVMPELDFDGETDGRIFVEVADVDEGDQAQVLLYSRSVTGMWFGTRLVLHGSDAGRHTCKSAEESGMTMEGCSGRAW